MSGPTTLPDPFGVTTVRVQTAAQMRDAVLAAYAEADAVVATAAVADFRPAAAAEHKQKKDAAPLTLELERTTDILAELGAAKGERLLIGFAAETQDVLEAAAGKLAAKNLDLVVANDVSEPGLGFGSDDEPRVARLGRRDRRAAGTLQDDHRSHPVGPRRAARARAAARGASEQERDDR